MSLTCKRSQVIITFFHLEQRAARRAYISKHLQYSNKKQRCVCSDPDVMLSTFPRQRQFVQIWALYKRGPDVKKQNCCNYFYSFLIWWQHEKINVYSHVYCKLLNDQILTKIQLQPQFPVWKHLQGLLKNQLIWKFQFNYCLNFKKKQSCARITH